MEPVTINHMGKSLTLRLVPMNYSDGRIAIQAYDDKDGLAWGVLTVNVPTVRMEDDESAIKDYSENETWAKPVLDVLMERGDCKRIGTLGLPHCIIPLVRWSESIVEAAA